MGKTAKTKSKVKVHRIIESRTDFFYYAFRNVLLVSIPLLVVSGVVLSHLSFHSSATGSSSGVDQIQFSLATSCTMSSVVDEAHTKEINNGTYHSDVGKTTITTLCNDGNGYSIYANGYSNNEEGNNKLINSSYPQYSIDTGLATSGLTSQWAMKLNNIENDPSPTPPTIDSSYNDTYGLVPSTWTKVAYRQSGTTDMSEGSSFTTTYSVYASSSQYAGTYVGQVKYVLTHPSTMTVYPIMQDIAEWKNIRIPNIGDSVQTIDERDGKKYWVTRLADNNIWMTQNLDLDLDPAKPLTSNDTDLTDHSLTRAYADDYNYDPNTGITIWTPERKTIDFQNTIVTGWGKDDNNPYSASKTDSTETGHASLGNYYNWTAAIASNNSSSLTQDTLSDISKNPQNSICPKGWRLPTISNQSGITINSSNEFARLNYLYNNNYTNKDTGLLSDPLYFGRTGYITDSGNLNANSTGYYWSSTVGDNTGAYNFHFNNTSVQTAENYRVRYNGFPIRCVAR